MKDTDKLRAKYQTYTLRPQANQKLKRVLNK